MKYFDGHCDIWADITIKRLRGETDVFHNHHFPQMQEGNVEGGMFVIWVDPPHDKDYEKRTHEQYQCITDEIATCKDFRIVKSYDEIMKAREDGIYYVMIGVEGMAYASHDPSLARIDEYYDFGARHGMLTWNECNAFGNSAASGSTEGLTDLGKAAMKKMQDKGMIVDTSHLNEAGFWDIAKLTEKPFIASHSNCKALRDVPRNLTDDQLRAIRDANGLVGLNSFGGFVDDDADKQDVEHLANHAEHMIDIMGIDHVGCGFDFNNYLGDRNDPTVFSGLDDILIGMENSGKIPELFKIFERRGMSVADMEKIAYKNWHRVIKECIG